MEKKEKLTRKEILEQLIIIASVMYRTKPKKCYSSYENGKYTFGYKQKGKVQETSIAEAQVGQLFEGKIKVTKPTKVTVGDRVTKRTRTKPVITKKDEKKKKKKRSKR